MSRRIREVPRLADEICRDEAIQEPLQSLKVSVYFRALDSLIAQMTDRFPEINLRFIKQISLFTEKSLKSQNRPEVKASDISELCNKYGFDAEQAAKEPQTFQLYYAERDEGESELSDDKVCTSQTQSGSIQ